MIGKDRRSHSDGLFCCMTENLLYKRMTLTDGNFCSRKELRISFCVVSAQPMIILKIIVQNEVRVFGRGRLFRNKNDEPTKKLFRIHDKMKKMVYNSVNPGWGYVPPSYVKECF